MTVAAWSAVVLLSIIAVALAYRGQRDANADLMFAGVTPGLVAVEPDAQVVPVPGFGQYRGEVAVAFNPPKGVRPGLAGTIVDGVAETRDVTATIVDLAARGFLTITITESESTRSGRDWLLHRAAAAAGDVDQGERQLLEGLFRTGDEVLLSQLPASGNPAVNDAKAQLVAECEDRGWFRHDAAGVRTRSVALIAAIGAILAAFASGSVSALVVAGLAAVGAWLIAARGAGRVPRSATGTAVRIQSLAFSRYLATAEKEQFSYEEAAGVFSRYLPYAIAFGVAEHWTKVFGELAAQAHEEGYVGDFDVFWLSFAGWGLADAAFDLAMLSALTDGTDLGGDLFGDGLGGDPTGSEGAGDHDAGGTDGSGDGGFGSDGGSDAGGWGDNSFGGDSGWSGADFGGSDFGGFGGE